MTHISPTRDFESQGLGIVGLFRPSSSLSVWSFLLPLIHYGDRTAVDNWRPFPQGGKQMVCSKALWRKKKEGGKQTTRQEKEKGNRSQGKKRKRETDHKALLWKMKCGNR